MRAAANGPDAAGAAEMAMELEAVAATETERTPRPSTGDTDAEADGEADGNAEADAVRGDGGDTSEGAVPRALAARLYLSHLLSTWNARVFEFAAVLFLAAAFPDTLRPLSVYAVVRGVAAMVLAEAVGVCIDRGDRLAVVRASIVGQRAAVGVSCAVFWVLLARTGQRGKGTDTTTMTTTTTTSPRWFTTGRHHRLDLGWGIGGAAGDNDLNLDLDLSPGFDGFGLGLAKRHDAPLADGLFVLAVVAACVEKLCSVMNMVAVERDWVVVMTEGDEAGRRVLSARMRRIDLFCKLAGPLAISLVAAASVSAALWTTLGMNAASVVVEYYSIAVRPAAWTDDEQATPMLAAPGPAPLYRSTSLLAGARAVAGRLVPFASMPAYFGHAAFLPSFSLALLYLTVLSFSGQMVTFLLAVGYTPLAVGLARTASTVCELSATWIAPRLADRIGVVRGGIWSLSWQGLWLAAATSWFLAYGDVDSGSSSRSLIAATGLAVGVALSRVGLWGFDLCAQSIVQDEVADAQRGAFSTAEAAFQNLFEVLAYVTTLVFPRPDQFRWPVAISVAAVYVASALYAAFVRRRRGHLFHSPLPAHAQRWLGKAFSRHPR